MAKSFPNTGATVGLAADRSALTSPFAGMQFFETDTKALYLYNGSAWVNMLDTDTPPGLVKIFTGSFSSSTGYATGNVFSSDFTNYKIILSVLSSTAATLYAKLRDSNNADISASNYDSITFRANSNGTSGVGSASAGSTYWVLFPFDINSGDPSGSYEGTIFSPYLSKRTNLVGYASHANSGVSDTSLTTISNRFINNTSASGLVIYPSTGTFSGNISVYGLKE